MSSKDSQQSVNPQKEKAMKTPKKGSEEKKLKLAEKVLGLFGRGEAKYIVLTPAIIVDALDIDRGEAQWVMSSLVEKSYKVAALTNQNGGLIYLARKVSVREHRFRYTTAELVGLLNPKYFDTVGRFLKGLLSKGETVRLDAKMLEEYDGELKLPSEILEQVIKCFADAGLVKLSKAEKLTMAEAGETEGLNYNSLRDTLKSVALIQRFTGPEIMPHQPTFNSLGDLARIYDDHDDETRVKTIRLKVDKLEVKFHGIMEALLGNQNADPAFLERDLEVLRQTPEKDRPDILVISGIIQGAFKNTEKNRRPTLTLKSDSQQFKAAGILLDECLKLGFKKVIYNCGDDDQKLWEAYTADALMIMAEANAKDGPSKDSKKKSLDYKQLDDLKRTKAWDFHYDFQARVVYEYMLRSHRRLLSADEVGSLTGRRMEEYLILLETYAALKKGQPVPEEWYRQVLKVDNIPLPGKEFSDFVVSHNFRAQVELSDGKVVNLWEVHDWNLTPTAMKQDPTKFARGLIGQLESSGTAKHVETVDGKKTAVNELPHIFAIEHQEQASAVLEGRTLVVSHPSARGISLDRDGITGSIQKDKGKRLLTTRGELIVPATQSLTVTSDDRRLIEIHSDRLLDKMHLSPQRVTIAFFSDWQNGSVTARTDLQVLSLDYTLHHILPKNPVHMIFCGDIFQGRNYSEMPNENVRMGLVRIRDQQRFVGGMLRKSIESVPLPQFKNLKGVTVTDGNHEWNSSHKLTGDTHSEFLPLTLELFFRYHGLDIPVNYHDKVRSAYGEHWNSWTAVDDIAGYKVLSQHYITDGGGKGGSGLKTNPARRLFEGTGDFSQELDLLLSGHFHTPTFQLVNGKIIVVNGSWAGTSGYEWMLGYRPMMGMVFIHLGGGKPPVVEFVTQKTMNAYKARGYYSDENLAKLSFVTDRGFNSRLHGFARIPGQPQSAIQKALWADVDDINWRIESVLGPTKK